MQQPGGGAAGDGPGPAGAGRPAPPLFTPAAAAPQPRRPPPAGPAGPSPPVRPQAAAMKKNKIVGSSIFAMWEKASKAKKRDESSTPNQTTAASSNCTSPIHLERNESNLQLVLWQEPESRGETSTPHVEDDESIDEDDEPMQADLDALEPDPGKWIPISAYAVNDQDRVRRRYIEMGPCQPKKHKFDITNKSGKERRFCHVWFKEFPWIEYSVDKDSAFCFVCYLFKDKTKCPGGDAFVKKGFRNWNMKSRLCFYQSKANNSWSRHCPIFQCSLLQHVACRSCSELHGGKCRRCADLAASAVYVQNSYLDTLFGYIKEACPYKKYGCTTSVGLGDQAAAHEAACVFEPCSCTHCSFKGSQADLVRHLRRRHKCDVHKFTYGQDYVYEYDIDDSDDEMESSMVCLCFIFFVGEDGGVFHLVVDLTADFDEFPFPAPLVSVECFRNRAAAAAGPVYSYWITADAPPAERRKLKPEIKEVASCLDWKVDTDCHFPVVSGMLREGRSSTSGLFRICIIKDESSSASC